MPWSAGEIRAGSVVDVGGVRLYQVAANYVAKQMDFGIRAAMTVDVACRTTWHDGQPSTMVDGPPPTTDQKVGGSTPSERAEQVQVRAHLGSPHLRLPGPLANGC